MSEEKVFFSKSQISRKRLELLAAPVWVPREEEAAALGWGSAPPQAAPASFRPHGGRAGISVLALPGLERPVIPRGSSERAHLVLINNLQLELA